MPRVNRKPKKKTSGYTTDHVYVLRWGHDFHKVFNGEDEIREAWAVFRNELLEDWMHEEPQHGRGGPGTRPWAWWKYDSKELRRRLNGIHPFENPERQEHIARVGGEYFPKAAYKVWFGKPNCLTIRDDFEAVYETEREYLTRLGLLTDLERDLLEAER